MLRTGALIAVCLAHPASAQMIVEECDIPIPASEGVSVESHIVDDVLRHARVTAYGHTGRSELSITPLGDGNAVINLHDFAYSGVVGEGSAPLTVTLSGWGRAIIKDGSICAQDGCHTGDITKERIMGVYDAYLNAYPDRSFCHNLGKP